MFDTAPTPHVDHPTGLEHLLQSPQVFQTPLPRAAANVLEIIAFIGGEVVELALRDGKAPVVLGAADVDPTAPMLIRTDGDGPRLVCDARGWVLLPTFDMAGFIYALNPGGEPERVFVRGETVLPSGARLLLEVDAVTFVIQEVLPSRRVASAPFSIDTPMLSLLSFLGISASIFGYALNTVPPPPTASTMDIPNEAVMINLLRQPPPTLSPKSASTGAHSGREGVAAKGHVKPQKGVVSKLQQALHLFDGPTGALLQSLQESTLPGGVRDGIAGLQGRPTGRGPGLNMRGEGPGGGGHTDSVGYDRQSLTNADNLARGCEGPRCKGKEDGAIYAIGGVGIVLGALDSADVDRVIKQNMPSIRYCYQKDLQSHPGTSGKIIVKFTIAANGTVSSATTRTSAAMPAVEACLKARFLTMQFPRPKGGGVVIVSYPFVFSEG